MYYSENGNLFGLSSTDLTEEQLNKVDIYKLAEFLNTDERVEKIICDKLFTESPNKIQQISTASWSNFIGRENLLKAYNEFVKDICNC